MRINSSKSCFASSPYFSSKYINYFKVYDQLLSRYIDKSIVFVEFGVFAGGSLFLWRNFFGPKARIIGVDLNPAAEKWREHGFEIYIGDQGSEEFLTELFKKIGPVDVVLDDGGHQFTQQIATSYISLNYIKNGGLLIVEDTHTSYFREYGAPSSHSFISWCNRAADALHNRYPRSNHNSKLGLISGSVHSIQFFESMVALYVDRDLCVMNEKCENSGIYENQIDYKYSKSIIGKILKTRRDLYSQSGVMPSFIKFLEKIFSTPIIWAFYFYEKFKLFSISKYFKNID